MSPCPSDETFHAFLGDALSEAAKGAVAVHVEACAACQERLASMTVTPETEAWRRAATDGQRSVGEEGFMRRLKKLPASWTDTVAVQAAKPTRATVGGGADWPRVPGYEIIGELGRGGMGIVYKARQVGLDRIVALKMVLKGVQAGPNELARFRAEAAAIARLQHPNIVQVFDVGEAAGRPFFVLEYVAGGSLAEHLRGTPQSVRAAAELVATLARAMHAAHADGVIHRDLKPANILLDCRLTPDHANQSSPNLKMAIPKITDFGVAKCAGGSGDGPFKGIATATGEILGTPNYMAPEQAMVSREPVGPPADIYALGAILYELLTGRPPFVGETPLETVLQTLHNDPVSVTSLQPTVPRDLETICMKCLRKEPAKRYGSALELADDLQRFLRDEPIEARPPTPVENLWRWTRRYPAAAALLAAALLAPLVALISLSLLSARLVRSAALESAAQQAELLEEANKEYSRIVTRVEKANFVVNKTVPPTPGTVPLSIPATFLHDVGGQLAQNSRTGVKVRQYSDLPFPWRSDGGPHDDFERLALAQLRATNGKTSVHEFTEIDGERVVRFAEARVMEKTCVDCHNSHPQSPRKTWQVGDVRGVLVIIRPLGKDETRVGEALGSALAISAVISGILLGGSVLLVWLGRKRSRSVS